MTQPTILSTPKLKADEKILRDLKVLLDMAEKGELESVCIVSWERNGNLTVYGLVDDATRKIGALTRMIYDLLHG